MDESQSKSLELEFNNLPKDIIFDIFSRIPLKTLYKLKCVCKKWLFLLDLDQEFRGFHHQKFKTSPILLFTQQNLETTSTQLLFHYIDGTQLPQFSTNFEYPLTSILTCNGILCLISNTKAFIYDPIIERLSSLPISSYFSSTFSWAFGFSSIRNEFKLIHFYTIEKFDNFHYCQFKELMCEIVTKPSSHLGIISIDEWRFISKCPYDILGRKDYAHVDGKFYWLIAEKRYNPDCIKIMSFDLDIESFGIVCFPRTYSNRSVECLDLVEIKDKLCLTDRLPWESTMDIWMMMRQEDGFTNLWVKIFGINLMGIDHHDVRIFGHLCKDYDFEEQEGGEILMKVGDQNFGLYEIEDQEFRLADKISMEGWNLQLMLDRKRLL